MQTWYEVAKQVKSIVATGSYSLPALKAAERHLVDANKEQGARRCTGQIVSRDYVPTFTYCGRYECFKCGSVRAWLDVERAIAGMVSGAPLGQLPTWYFCTVTYDDAERRTDSHDKQLDFQANIRNLLNTWRIVAKRDGHTLQRVVFYGYKATGQIHAHIVASWLPDAVFDCMRGNYAVCVSKWLKKACSAFDAVSHVEVAADVYAIGHYIKRNIDSTLFKTPKHMTRVSFSRSWVKQHVARDMAVDVRSCGDCGQIAVDTADAPARCKCGGKSWSPAATKYISAATLPDKFLLYTQEFTNKTQISVILQACSTCKTEQPLTAEYWHRDKSKSTGYERICKECRRKRDKRRNKRLRRQCQNKASVANKAAQNAKKGHSDALQTHMLTTAEVLDAYKATDGHCAYCDTPLDSHWQLEHYRPLSRGGANTPANIRAVCADCNRQKGSMTPARWLSRLAARGIVTDDTPNTMPVQRRLYTFNTIKKADEC